MALMVLRTSGGPGGCGVIEPVEGGGGAWAAVSPWNPLEASPEAVALCRGGGGGGVVWSGSLAGWRRDDEEGAFERDPRTWGPAGWAALGAWCDSVEGSRVVLRPNAAHVLSDGPSCLRFLASRAEQGFRLLLDPAGMLTGGMLPRAEDHLERILGSLARHPATAGVVVANVGEGGVGGGGRPAPLHAGVLDPAMIVRVVGRHVPPGLPLVLLEGEIGAQRGLLAGLPHAS